jgi:ATP-dependent DNA helicase RecG
MHRHTDRFDITPFLGLSEGQHFERKSLFQGEPGKKMPRDRKAVRDHIAECVAAFANAEGGVAILGIEDDGTVTGHTYPKDAVDEMFRVPSSRIQAAFADGFRILDEGKELLVFEVTAADAPVMVTGNGYPLRVADSIVKMEEPKIRALKLVGFGESWGNRASPATLADLDPQLLSRAKSGAGYPDISDEEYLLTRKLADRKGTGIVLRRAAELLFAREPDHANAGIRILRVLGTERRVGVDYNVEELPRAEGPLPQVLTEVFNTIQGLLRTPARLRGTRFTPTPEYPDFAWKEAILNAVAHRDYGNQGRSVEVSLFDDHMEVTSPGGLLPEISLDALRKRVRTHESRNPRLVRALVDLGFMRDQGEGLPRLFAEMEGLFLPVPELASSSYGFSLTLQNTPMLTDSDRAFIGEIGSEELSSLEFRALLEAFRQGRVTHASMRSMAGLDILQASRLLVSLRDRGFLEPQSAEPATYYILPSRFAPGGTPVNPEGNSRQSEGELPSIGGVTPGDSGGTPGNPQRNSRRSELPSIGTPGNRPRRNPLRSRIAMLCTDWRTPVQLATALGNRSAPDLTRRHLSPMVEAGLLERRHAEKNHPAQAYRAVVASEAMESTDDEG